MDTRIRAQRVDFSLTRSNERRRLKAWNTQKFRKRLPGINLVSFIGSDVVEQFIGGQYLLFDSATIDTITITTTVLRRGHGWRHKQDHWSKLAEEAKFRSKARFVLQQNSKMLCESSDASR